MTFRVGDLVTWTSQAGGSHKTKVGEVYCVVPRGWSPSVALKVAGLPGKVDFEGRRQEESYVVKVGRKLYWPRVAWLRPCTGEMHDVHDARLLAEEYATTHPSIRPAAEHAAVILLGEVKRLRAELAELRS